MGLWKQLQLDESKPLSETRRQIFENVRLGMLELGFENPFRHSSRKQPDPNPYVPTACYFLNLSRVNGNPLQKGTHSDENSETAGRGSGSSAMP